MALRAAILLGDAPLESLRKPHEVQFPSRILG